MFITTKALKNIILNRYLPILVVCLSLAACGSGSTGAISAGVAAAPAVTTPGPITSPAPITSPQSVNSAPTASAIHINGTVTVGSVLKGLYSYSDVDGDAQGTSTFRWLRDGVVIAGATAPTYTLISADIGTVVAPPVIPVGVKITFEVTPVAVTGTLKGAPVSYAVTTKAKALHPIGTNLAGVTDWSTELVFNDLFKRARAWGSSPVNWGDPQPTAPLVFDANGWVAKLAPKQAAVSYILAGFKGHLPKGTYRLSYKGSGVVTVVGTTVLNSGSGWMDIQFISGNNIPVKISKTDPLNYIRDIKIQPLKADGTVNTATFRTAFLNRWRPFNTLRFMDWMRTNFIVRYKPQYATAINWSDRPKVTDFSQATGNGVALEYMIELANTLKINPWFNMPATATDAYVRQFATMVKNKLDPALKAHVEYSNEVWNGIFPAAHYAKRMATKLGLTYYYNFYTHRALQIFGIWKSVFGAAAPTRLVRVLAGQSVNIWLSTRIIDFEFAYKNIDAFAIAPYFGWERSLVVTPVPTMSTLFTSVDAHLVALNTLFGQYALMTKTRNVKLVAYEGGPGMVTPKDLALTAMITQMNRDPYMYTLYTRYFTNWFLDGGGLFMNFSSVYAPSKFGNWGVLEWYDQSVSTTSKYAAIKDALYRP